MSPLRRSYSGAVAALLVLVGLVVAGEASATHVNTVVVTQIATNGLSVTLQVDLTYNTGSSGNGVFNWTTGDGGSGAVLDGTTSGGGYAGDGSGTGTFSGSRPTGIADTTTFSWVRTQPAANVARTRLTYNYASGRSYTVGWNVCCPSRTGSLVVTVAGDTVNGPFYPMGIIEIGPATGGGVTYTYTGFFPAWSQWTCVESGWTGSSAEVDCYPPSPPSPNLTNVCQFVNVLAQNSGTGAVTGTSKCASGRPATAVATPPSGYAADSQNPATAAFPWTCSATVAQTVPAPWRVRCAISH